MDDLQMLQARRAFCLLCIQTVSDADPSDPRRDEAIAEYNRQLASIDQKIAALTGEIPAVVVGLKTATLLGKTK